MNKVSLAYHNAFTGTIVGDDGVERHYINGAYGRAGDLPSVVHPDGSKQWFKENPNRGKFGQTHSFEHRDGDLPAIVRANGDQLFYKNGKLHRDGDKPAVILAGVAIEWFENGVRVAYQNNGMEKVEIRKKATLMAVK